MSAPGRPRGATFWIGIAIGWILIGYGVRGVFVDANATQPAQLFAWVLGAAVVHDLLIAPMVLLVSWLLSRLLDRHVANAAKMGLATSAVLVAFSWALVRGYGRRRTLPSVLPLDYGHNLLVAISVIWAALGLYLVVRSRWPGRRRA
jgi:hypothetical protein